MPKHPGSESVLRQHASASKAKYPVSGLSSHRISSGASRKTPSVSHRHPNDKLPEIKRATPNDYVLTEPRTTKHKTMQSHS